VNLSGLERGNGMNVKKITIYTLSISAITLLTVLFIVIRGHKPRINIRTVPDNSKILINNRSYQQGTLYLSPGKYKATVKSPGFSSITLNINVDNSYKKVNHYLAALTPVSTEAQKWASKNQDQYNKIEELGGQASEEASAKLVGKNPIIQYLPFRSLLYNIDYRLIDQSTGDIALQIGGDTPNERWLAIEQIRNWGYDPASYNIDFTRAVNPFGGDSE
jgi:hypothetical protein